SNSFSLKSGTAASMYATGYLACMYLGYLASGSTSVTAADISKGLGRILCDLVGGKSLDTVINERTGGKYSSISDIEGKFGNQDSSSFIYALTQAAGSSGNGGLAAGSLTAGDLLPDSPASISLFELDITNDIIKNIYPSGVNVLSGGGKSSQGDAPVSNYASTIGEGSEAAANTGTTIDLSNISSAAGVYYDSSQKILMITGSGDYTLKGASSAGVRVMVTNGVNANITLDNAKINTSAGSGISLEGNARVTLNLIGNNSVISSTQRMAGIRVTTGAALNINGNGTLEVENNDSSTANGAGIGGAFGESGGNIVIDGGNITVKGTAAGAGIGGGLFGSGGDITINGGNISVVYAQAGSTVCSGAGIGGGFWGDGGKITITGGTVNSTSSRSGAGIGGGNHSSGGTIEVTGGTINAGGATGIGGGDGGTAGDIKITGGTVTAKGSNGGAGIGSGSGNNGGSIIIDGSGVIIKATGSGSSANIGGGANSPVSSGTVAKNSGIVFEGANGTVYGNTTVGTPLDCEGKPLTVLGGSTLTVSNGGKIINQGIITNSGCIENHGVIGTVTGTGITHNYVTGITRQIKEPDTAVVGESLASSIAGLSPSRITVSYNGTTRTLAGVWSVTDLDGHPVTDLAGTIVREGDSYIYSVSFTSEDNIYFDPLNMSFYEMQGNGAEKSKYGMVTDKYVSASGPQGGGSTLTYSFVVNSAAKGEPPPEEPPKNPPEPTKPDVTSGMTIQLGANANQTMIIAIDNVSSQALEIAGLSVLTREEAENAIDVSFKAIGKVSQIRGKLGAYQNRLEHSIDIINNTEENLESAESRIRDFDIAKGMLEYAKYQMLIQIGQAMLAQANQSPKSVLALLS
ncbi:MAG TPA: flagellin, partial [Ruminiclostridium sp.]|nr:flagellin [Ruminiclostridium sp.]